MSNSAATDNGLSLRTSIRQSTQQVSCDLGDEIVALSLRNGAYYGLDAVAARIWALVETPRTVEAILDALLSEYAEVDAERCTREVLGLLRQLAKWELVELEPTDR